MRHLVRDFMSDAPLSIGLEQPLTAAHALMCEHAVRHLPVLHGGKLVGILSQRDLHLIETLRDVHPEEVRVEEAMSQEVYAVAPTAELREVAGELAKRRLGSAVVMDGAKVVGIFTTVDALRALETVLGESERSRGGRQP